jgi:5S rRNA maturation endonuclease (ribonuclease M5)
MPYYVKHKQTDERCIVLTDFDEGGKHFFLISAVKTRVILKIESDSFTKNYFFAGIID